jgi:hypothetical protein
MNTLKKALAFLTSQIKKSDVKLPTIEKPHKIRDDNQSIHDGVIHEKFDTGLRGSGKTSAGRKRSSKSKRDA